MAFLSKMLASWRHKVITPYLKGDVLDIGCGDAIILKKHHVLINHYVGIELGQTKVDNLSALFPEAVFISRDLDREPLSLDERFDTILMIAVIEHIWNQKFLFEQIISLLKPDGKIVITTPTIFGNDIIHPLGAALDIFAKAAVDDHIVVYNKQRLKNLAREFGLHLLIYRRFQFFSNQIAVLSKGIGIKN
jgi:2-polyprenyl-3-methyl-5-hydroxy-6-metoxy-1,4-benzoquinol methylase